MRKCECGCNAFDVEFEILTCQDCGREWMLDDDGHLYDPSDPPGPLWSLSLHDYV